MIRWSCMKCNRSGESCECRRKRKIKLIYDPVTADDVKAKFNRQP